MILLDLSQTCHAVAAVAAAGSKTGHVDLDVVRQMIVDSVRRTRLRFRDDYGEMVVCCDSGVSWRRDSRFSYYKANRKRRDDGFDWEAFAGVVADVRDGLRDRFPFRTVAVDGAEGDDVVAVLMSRYGGDLLRSGDDRHLIVSGDKDFRQLHAYDVDQYSPTRDTWVEVESPHRALFDLVVTGDVDDGVPNVLSDDDSLVDQQKRQRTVTAKLKDVLWREHARRVTDDTSRDALLAQVCFEVIPSLRSGTKTLPPTTREAVVANLGRNRRLVDLRNTPEHIAREVVETYESQRTDYSFADVSSWLSERGMSGLLERVDDFR